MKKSNFLNITLFLCLMFGFSISDDLIRDYINGEISTNSIQFNSLSPNQNQQVLLNGLSAIEGEKAKDYLVDYYYSDDDLYDDIASMKIAEYYYSIGSYLKSSNWYKIVALDYENSEYYNTAKTYYLNSLVIIGQKDSADFYTRKFQKKKKINFDNSFFKRKTKDSFSNIDDESQYSVQVGSFSSYQAAKKMRKVLSAEGFLCRIDTIQRNYETFYSVRIGNFKNKLLATKEQKRLKYRIGIYDSIIVKLN